MIKMKKYIKIICLIILISLITSTHYSTFASYDIKIAKGGLLEESGEKTIDTNITSDRFVDSLDPNSLNNGGRGSKLSSPFVTFIQSIVNPILGFVQTIGGFLMIVALSMFGLGMLLSSNKALAEEFPISMTPNNVQNLIKYGRQLLIGSVLLFFSATLVKFVFQIFNI